MPELPEVETVCRGLEPVLKGQVIARADIRRKDLRRPFPKGLKNNLEDRKIVGIRRRAKYILIDLDNDHVLIIHLGMSGRMRVMNAQEEPGVHDHFIITLQSGRTVALNDPRRFGIVDFCHRDACESHTLFAHLGPEPMGNGFSGPVLADSIRGKKMAIKNAIMDQMVVVGVGNIYASESLFLAGINPKIQAGRVQGTRADALVSAIRSVLDRAIKAGGSTLRDHRQANGDLGYFQHQFAVYDRAGQACPGCSCDIGKTRGIQRIVQGGRSTFYCPRKQK